MYNVDALKKEHPASGFHQNPDADRNPKLRDFLVFGGLTELCEAILDQLVPDPWLTIALAQIPPSAMLSVMYLRMAEEARSAERRRAQDIATVVQQLTDPVDGLMKRNVRVTSEG